MKKVVLLIACMCSVLMLFAQRTISGRVLNGKGEPVPSASVQVRGSSVGTVTGPDGRYTLAIPAGAR